MEPSDKSIVAYIVSKELVKISSLLPSNKNRSTMVHSLINSLGLLSPSFSPIKRIQIINPFRATYKDLTSYHSRDYIDFVLDHRNLSTNSPEFGIEDDCPPFQGLHEYVPLVGGASLTAANVLIKGIADVAICWDGGRHHAHKSHATGFCYVADCILAILALKRSSLSLNMLQPAPSRKPRIMYLDLDLHFSDAVSEAFSSYTGTPQILTISIHHAAPGFFPTSALSQLPASPCSNPFTLSLPLKPGASDATLTRIWPLIETLKDAFKPDYTIVQCGTDALAGDPCATFNYSLTALNSCINRVVHYWPGRKLLLGGGGYHSANTARTWASFTSIALAHPLPLDTPIPEHAGFPFYAPSFTLDVPAGTMQDQNLDAYLCMVEARFAEVTDAIEAVLG